MYHKSAFCKRYSVYVRFAPIATEVLRRRELTRSADCIANVDPIGGEMVEHQIRYDDGAAYEWYMGNWSRLAGEMFLNWLAPRPGLGWIDIGCGCGSGAF